MASTGRRRLTPVPSTRVEVDDPFWAKRIETNRKRQITREAKRGEDAVKRIDEDRAELARLQALYPEGVPS